MLWSQKINVEFQHPFGPSRVKKAHKSKKKVKHNNTKLGKSIGGQNKTKNEKIKRSKGRSEEEAEETREERRRHGAIR